MKATTEEGAYEALSRAFTSLEDGDMRADAAWASIAADTIESVRLTPDEIRELAAPRDDTPTGEKVAFVIVVLVAVWLVVDTLLGAFS